LSTSTVYINRTERLHEEERCHQKRKKAEMPSAKLVKHDASTAVRLRALARSPAIEGEDRARKGRDNSEPAAPGAFASTEKTPRSKKSSGTSRSTCKSSNRSKGNSSSRSEGRARNLTEKNRTWKPATVPGAVTSSERSRSSSGKDRLPSLLLFPVQSYPRP